MQDPSKFLSNKSLVGRAAGSLDQGLPHMGRAIPRRRTVRLPALTLPFFLLATSIAGAQAEKSAVTSGNWASGGTWNGGAVPAAGDNVTIGSGLTVTMNASPTVNNLTIAGSLKLGATGTTGYTLTINGVATVQAGGLLTHKNGGNNQHSVKFKGHVVNDGTIDFFVNTVRYISMAFENPSDIAITGSGAWDTTLVTFNCGSASTLVTNQSTSFWTTQSSWASGTPVVFTRGIYVHDNSSTWDVTRNLDTGTTTSITVGAESGLRAKNGTISVFTSIAGSYLLLDGKLEVQDSGTITVGDAVDERITYESGSQITVSGGTLNVAGRIWPYTIGDTVAWNQSGGTVTLATAGSTDTSYGALSLLAPGSSFTWSSGTIVLPRSTSGPTDVDIRAGTHLVTGGTLQCGNSLTPSSTTFRIASAVPLFHLTVNGDASVATKPTVKPAKVRLHLKGDVSIASGTTLDSNNLDLFVGGNLSNNGTFNGGTSRVTFNGSSTLGGSSTTVFHHLAVTGSLTLPPGTARVEGDLSVTGTITPGSGTLAMTGSSAALIKREWCDTSADGARSIPDNDPTGVLSNLVVSGQGTVLKVVVTIYLLHSWDADLDLSLLHPDGSEIVLSTDNGGGGQNYIATVFDDSAPTSIAAGTAPFTGTYRPQGLLSGLNGKTANGTWKLSAKDDDVLIAGTLLGWSLAIATDTSGAIQLNHLTVNPSASVAKTMEWPLDIDGTVTISSGILASSPSLAHTVAGNWINTVSGGFSASTSAIKFDGTSGTQVIGGAADTSFYDLELANSATRQFGNDGSARTFTVTHTFAWTAGNVGVGQDGIADRLYLTGPTTVTVPAGYALSTSGSGIVDIGGASATAAGIKIEPGNSLALSGSTASVSCSGNWSNDGTFTANGGSVVFTGSSDWSVTGSSPTTFYELRVNSAGSIVSLSVDLGISHRLEVNAGTLLVGPGRTVTIASGGSLAVAGELRLLGSSGSLATLTSPGTYSMTVSGSLNARRFAVTGVDNAGIVFGAAAEIVELNEGTLTIAGPGPALDFSNLTAGDPRRVPYAFVDVTFSKTSPSPADRNVKTSSATPTLWFLGSSADNGQLWGAAYEDDAAGRITWSSDAVERILYDVGAAGVTSAGSMVTGIGTDWASNVSTGDRFRVRGETGEYTVSSVDSDTQLTLTTAYQGPTGTAKSYEVYSATKWATIHRAVSAGPNVARYRWRSTIPTSESFDAEFSKSSATQILLENVKWYRRGGECVRDSDSGSARRIVLRNCTVGRGDLSKADLYNCTLFHSGGSAPTLTDCGAMNSIVQGSPSLADLNGPDPDANLTGGSVTASLFVNPDHLDFHLKPTASAAIDQGQVPPAPNHSRDMDDHLRPYNGIWDIGADEYPGSAATPRALAVAGGASGAKLGSVSRFHSIGATRGSSSGYSYGYLTTGGGGMGNNNTFLVVRWNSGVFEIVASYAAPGPILYFAHRVDVTSGNSAWRAWIFLVVDAYREDGSAGQDGHGDSILCLVDRGDAGLSHPTGPGTSSDVTARRFGSIDYYGDGTVVLYRPTASGVNYRFSLLTVSAVQPDGTADADGNGTLDDPPFNSPPGTNRMRWSRLYLLAFKRTATTGGALLKINADPYDSDSTDGPDGGDNQAFGETMWAIVPSLEDAITNGTTAGWYNFATAGAPAFTWASGFQELFVPVSQDPGTARTLVVRVSLAGLTASPVSRSWQAEESDENDFGVWLDNGNVGASLTYGESDGATVYNRNVESASGGGGLWWATKLRNAQGTAVTLSVQPLQYWGTSFVVAGGEGVVEKFWSPRGTRTNLIGATAGGEGTIAVDSTYGFPGSGTLYIGTTAIPYSGTTSTTFTGCSDVGTHPSGAPVFSSTLLGTGARAGDGKTGRAETSAPGDESAEIAGKRDPDWPFPCVGKPVRKIVMSGTKLYVGTDRGYVYGRIWNDNGSSFVGGDETLLPGFPYVIPGQEITWILILPGGVLMIGTNLGLYKFGP